MAEKGFGVKEVNLIGASGTPTITSPNNLNLNAVNVAISTNASIGGNLTVSGTVGIAGTLTYEDVTNIDSVGLITARSGILVKDDATFETANSNNIVFDKSDNALEFGNGVKAVFNNNLQIYNDGTNRIKGSSGGIFIGLPGSFQIMDQNFANPKFEAGGTHAILYSAGVKVARSHENRFEVGNPDVGIGIGATISTIGNAQFVGVVTASSFSGSGANLTGIAITEAPVTDYTITGDGSHYYFHGGGVDETAGDPDLYLIRGQKYRFNNTTGSNHPFEFRIASGGSAYSNGVSGDDEGVQFFTVPYDAPAKIFYQCTVHGGMVGNIYIRGAGGHNDNIGLTTFRDNVRIAQPAGTDAIIDINEGTTTNAFRIMQTATEARIINAASIPLNIRSQSGSGSTQHLAFWTRDSERVRIGAAGKVGIGTINPSTKLDVDGDITIRNGSEQNAIRTNSDGKLQLLYNAAVNNTPSVTIDDANGYVGINTDNPTARLEISHGVTASQKSAAWMDLYDTLSMRIFSNQTSRLGLYSIEQGDWSSGVVLGTIDGSTTRKWGIAMASDGKSAYSSGLYFGYRADTSNTGTNTFATMTHSLILPTTGDVRVNVGNLVIATNNKGISFSGSSSSPDADSTSNTRLLSDYDEGTCDWELHRSDGLTTGSNTATTKVTYTKIGNRVMMSGYIYTASTGSSSGVTARLTDASGNDASLPYTPNHSGTLPVTHTRTISEYERMSVSFGSGSKTVYVHTDEGNNSYTPNTNNVAISSPQTHLVIAFTGSYTTDE